MNPKRLLIVEDDPATRWVLKRLAEKAGYETSSTPSARGFSELKKTFQPTLISLDLKISGGDGVELLSHLAEEGTAVAIMIISGFDNKVLQSTGRMAREMGLNVVKLQQKPLNLQELTRFFQDFNPQPPDRPLLTRQPAALNNSPDPLTEIRCAIEVGNILPYYQPKVDLASGRVCGVEALARWQHPERGLLLPSEFIPLLEKQGLMRRMTRSILEQSLHDASLWQRRGHELTISVNISPQLLDNKFFPEDIAAALQRYQFPEHLLMLEITETAAMKNPTLISEVLNRLRLKHIRLSMDDFGTGYSSLVELQRMPFSELKIDMQFVQSMLNNADSRTIVEAMIQLGHKLAMQVTIEGVETRTVAELSRELQADIGQGFYFSAAMAADDFIQWCSSR